MSRRPSHRAIVQARGEARALAEAWPRMRRAPAGFNLRVEEALRNQLVVGEPLRLDVVDGPLGRIISADRRDLEARHHGG